MPNKLFSLFLKCKGDVSILRNNIYYTYFTKIDRKPESLCVVKKKKAIVRFQFKNNNNNNELVL